MSVQTTKYDIQATLLIGRYMFPLKVLSITMVVDDLGYLRTHELYDLHVTMQVEVETDVYTLSDTFRKCFTQELLTFLELAAGVCYEGNQPDVIRLVEDFEVVNATLAGNDHQSQTCITLKGCFKL